MAPAARGKRVAAWLELLRRTLDAAPACVTFSFRDDDAGWATDRLLPLLDLFAYHGIALDIAVIPAALDERLAASLLRRASAAPGVLAFHQHGFAHRNNERSGRPCEFGPGRTASAQRRDIAAGAARLAALLGETRPIFTPPWNRCTRTTGKCLLELGFRALARDSTAPPLDLERLCELQVHVDWSRSDTGTRLADAVRGHDTVGVMLHHALMGASDRKALEQLLTLLEAHENARCAPLGSGI